MKIRCYSCMKEYDSQYEVCPHCGHIRTDVAKEPYQLRPGTKLQGRYTLGEVIDYGGFSSVYKAWDETLMVTVAIKEYYPAGMVQRVPNENNVIVLAGHDTDYKKGISRFLSEARNTNKFAKNVNVVNIQTFFEANGTAYIVMEYLEGCSLSRYLDEHDNRIHSEIAVNILISVIAALKDVHHAGIVHRDISPSNIFLCTDGIVKLIDFGAAKFPGEEDDIIIELKPGYAPPEQYQVQAIQDARTDIYALGATLYRAVTGIIPDESTNRIIEDVVKSPRAIDKTIPGYLDKTLMKAIALPKELRFKNVEQFEKAIQHKRHVKNVEKELKRRKRRRVRLIVGFSAFIIAGAIYSYITYSREKMKEELPEENLNVWMVADNEEEIIAKRTLFEAMTEEFSEKYPQVTCDISFFNSSEYSDAIDKAALVGEGPDLFECTDLSDYSLYFAAQYPEAFGDFAFTKVDAYIPSFVIYDPYYRKIPIAITTELQICNTKLLGVFEKPIKTDKDMFKNGLLPVELITLSEYREIRDSMAGEYAIIENPHLEYDFVWAIGADANYKKQVCAARILYYMLGERAQQKMYQINDKLLPTNIKTLSEYMDIYPELDYIVERLTDNRRIDFEKCDYEQYFMDEVILNYSEVKANYQQ